MKLDWLNLAALAAGWAAFCAEIMYLRGIEPLQAGLGIYVSGALQLIWFVALAVAIRTNGAKSVWVLIATLPALIGPAVYIALIRACALDTSNCR